MKYLFILTLACGLFACTPNETSTKDITFPTVQTYDQLISSEIKYTEKDGFVEHNFVQLTKYYRVKNWDQVEQDLYVDIHSHLTANSEVSFTKDSLTIAAYLLEQDEMLFDSVRVVYETINIENDLLHLNHLDTLYKSEIIDGSCIYTPKDFDEIKALSLLDTDRVGLIPAEPDVKANMILVLNLNSQKARPELSDALDNINTTIDSEVTYSLASYTNIPSDIQLPQLKHPIVISSIYEDKKMIQIKIGDLIRKYTVQNMDTKLHLYNVLKPEYFDDSQSPYSISMIDLSTESVITYNLKNEKFVDAYPFTGVLTRKSGADTDLPQKIRFAADIHIQ